MRKPSPRHGSSRSSARAGYAVAALAVALIGAASGCARSRPVPSPAAWSSEVLVERGQRALAEGDGARAEQYLAFAIDRGASVERVLPLLLTACIAGDRLETALVHAERHRGALRDPGRLEVLIAALHLALGQQERAIEFADDAIGRGEAPPLAYYLRGTARAALGEDGRQVRADYRRYLAAEPDGRYGAEVRRVVRRRAR